jgi:tetratricopeptide (TPR) repeat protein
MLAVLGTALGGALVFGVGSLLRSPAPDASAPAAAAAAITPPAEPRDNAPGPDVAPSTIANAAPTGATAAPPPSAAEAPAAAAEPNTEGSAPARDFYVAKLDDSQLVEWFELERRKTLPSCAERLGKKVKYSGKQPQQSRTKVKAARAALLRGKLDLAYTELCVATAHDPANVDAQRSLAELALDMGDPARAKEAAERGLARAPKNAELLGLLGDALALTGDIAGSRRTWLELDKKGTETQRRQRLAQSFVKAGEKASSSSKFARSRSYFRRALILTEGSYGPSMGLGDALLLLAEPRAGLAWAERAARAQPKSARAQLLLGDAYAKNGKPKEARAAWQAARRLEPKNKMAALRLSRGLR